MRVGVDLGGTKVEAAVLDADGTMVERRRSPTPVGDYDGTLDTIAALVDEMEASTGEAALVGVGTPGSADPETGRLRNANSVILNGRRFGSDLGSRIGREVRIANDADCFALSEAADGAGRGARTVFGVILGTGVGGGVVVDGRLVRGPNGLTGEWGHTSLPWPRPDELPGPACYCGRHGCIETWIAGPSLARDHTRRTGEELAAPEIVAAADRGEPAATETVERHADRVARALSMMINVLDPDAIVLGGGISNVGALYELVPRWWHRYSFVDRVRTPLLRNVHGDSSGVRGAARLWETPASS